MKTPILEPYMITVIQDLVSKAYVEELNKTPLKHIAKEQGLAKAKEVEHEVRENRFTPIGKLWSIQKRLDEISASYIVELKES
jgi:hypothetical protein